jgi:hypothetical protein
MAALTVSWPKEDDAGPVNGVMMPMVTVVVPPADFKDASAPDEQAARVPTATVKARLVASPDLVDLMCSLPISSVS